MIVIFNRDTGEIYFSVWSDSLPNHVRLNEYEDYLIIKGNVDPHKLHLCRLVLDEKKKPKEIEEPEFEYTGVFPADERRTKGWKKHKIIEAT